MFQGAPQRATPGSISGTLVEEGTGKAVSEARLQVMDTAGSVYSAISDPDGKFLFPALTPDVYTRLSVQAQGYAKFDYDAHPELPALNLSLRPKLDGIRIELIRTGSISGRILDADGNPAVDFTVQALQPAYENGDRTWKLAQSRPTNDLGEFRFFWLTPGRYYIRCLQTDSIETFIHSALRTVEINDFRTEMVPAAIRIVADDGSVRDEGLFPVYYPGTPESAMAIPIEVRPGSQVSGIEFQSLRVPVHRVAGKISGLPGRPDLDRFVRLVPIGTGLAESLSEWPDLSTSIADDLSFEIAGVPPGSYMLLADVSINGYRLSGRARVEVQNSDVSNVVVNPVPNVELSGHFHLEGESAGDPTLIVFTEIRLRSELRRTDYITGTIDGAVLKFPNVPPGDYQLETDTLAVRVSGRNEALPVYIDSISTGNQNVLQDGLHVSSSDQTMEIGLRSNFARLSGRVNPATPAAFGAMIVLIPDNRNDRIRFKSAAPGRDGSFQFADVSPGNYHIFAWDHVDDGAWFNAQFLAEFEGRGRPLTIVPGDNVAGEIPLI